MCHDCIVTFFRTFPMLAEHFGQGHHSYVGDVPCCEFAHCEHGSDQPIM
jgi:hypothetical protein